MSDPFLNSLLRRMGGPPVVPTDADVRKIVANDPRFRNAWDETLKPLDVSRNLSPIAEGVYKSSGLTSQAPVTRKDTATPRKLADQRDMAWIHLGCAYEMLRISTDILSQYRIENNQPNLYVSSYCFDRVWLGGLSDWGTMIQGIELSQETACVRWLLNQLFVRRRQKTWWRLRRERVRVSDPSRPPSNDPADQITVSVFLPLGNRGTTFLRQGSVPTVAFSTDVKPPDHLTPAYEQFT